MNKLSEEKGAATLIEYAIVLPIVLGVMFLLVFAGFTMHQRAVMEAATERSAIYVARTLADPNYENIVTTDNKNDVNDVKSVLITQDSIKNKPYRYLFQGSGSLPDSEASVSELIQRNQIFLENAPVVTVEKKAGIFTKVTVTATQDYAMPKILPGLNLPSFITIHTESVAYVNQPSEFIRNADYTMEIVNEVAGPVIDKLNTVISKISFFNSNVK